MSAGKVIVFGIGGAVVLAIGLGLLLRVTNPQGSNPPAARTETTVASPTAPEQDPFASLPRDGFYQAAAIFGEYEANDIRAAKRFGDKLIPITGMVTSISTDILGSPYIVLGKNHLSFGVQCMFPSDKASDLEDLNPGSTVFVVGTVSGKFLNVIVNDCRFVKPID